MAGDARWWRSVVCGSLEFVGLRVAGCWLLVAGVCVLRFAVCGLRLAAGGKELDHLDQSKDRPRTDVNT